MLLFSGVEHDGDLRSFRRFPDFSSCSFLAPEIVAAPAPCTALVVVTEQACGRLMTWE